MTVNFMRKYDERIFAIFTFNNWRYISVKTTVFLHKYLLNVQELDVQSVTN